MSELSIHQIKNILPHRPPILMLDKVLEYTQGEKVVAIKNVAINDEVFKGHFPNNPVMPGTAIVEAMAQAAIILYYTQYEKELKSKPEYYLGSIKSDFLKPVCPGDQLKIEVNTVRMLPTMAFVSATAFVRNEKVAHAQLTFAIKR